MIGRCLPAGKPLWIDDQLNTPIANPPGFRGIGDNRLVGAMTYHEQLLLGNGTLLNKRIVDGQGLSGGEVVVAGELLRMGGRVVGVSFDTDNLIGEISPQLGSHVFQQLIGPIDQVVTPGHEELGAGNFNPYHVAILPHLDTWQVPHREIF